MRSEAEMRAELAKWKQVVLDQRALRHELHAQREEARAAKLRGRVDAITNLMESRMVDAAYGAMLVNALSYCLGDTASAAHRVKIGDE